MSSPPPGDANGPITSPLVEFGPGKREVESLIPLVYSELRRVVAAYMRRERGNHTLQATALINEAWLPLADQPAVNWHDRVHFFAVASRVMRQILVDHARKKKADKRGGAQYQVTLQDHLIGERKNLADVLALNEALDRLQELDARAARTVELHFFGGLSFEEMEEVLEVSTRTIKRDWRMARTWLRLELPAAMTPEDWERLKPVLEQAEDLPEAQRPAFVEKICLQDPDLGRLLKQFLAAGEGAQSIDEPVFDIHEAFPTASVDETSI